MIFSGSGEISVEYERMGRREEHEEDSDLAMVEKLLNENGNNRLDAGKVILLLWKCRRDPRLVAAAAGWLESHSDVRATFDGVEEYLIVLAHMLIHLDVDWPTGTLERFTLIVAQQSPHLALQLHWILRASMEDYAPMINGKGGNELYYRRCAHLDEDIESIVAYGTARPLELERLFERGEIDRNELSYRGKSYGASIAQRLVEATLRPVLQAVDGRVGLLDPNFVPHRKSTYSGAVRWRFTTTRKKSSSCCSCSSTGRKHSNWKKAYAKIEGRSLLVYLGPDADDTKWDAKVKKLKRKAPKRRRRLVRALPLDGASVQNQEESRHRAWSFGLRLMPRQAGFAPIQLRFLTAQIRHAWLEHFVHESQRKPRPLPDTEDKGLDLSLQRRHTLFADERDFADALVDVAEQLRFVPRALRQSQLASRLRAVRVPPLAYLPLCNSTDTWRTVLSVVVDEGSVFNTKERCPCLLFFETAYERGLEKLDVANVIHAHVSGSSSLTLHSLASPTSDVRASRLVSSDGNIFSNTHDQSRLQSRAEEQMTETKKKERSCSEPPRIMSQPLSRASIWRPEVISPLVLQQPALFPDEATSSSPVHTPVPKKKKNEQIQARAARVLTFWRQQLHSASQWVEVHAPVSALRAHNETQRQQKGATYGESFAAIEAKLKRKSIAAESEASWSLRAVIVKSNDDLRQEVFVVQLIARYEKLFRNNNLNIYLRPYRIIALSATTGMIELISDSISLDKLFSSPDYPGNLYQHFIQVYGPEDSSDFQTARSNFIASAVGAALISYLLLIKDRHNGNILLDKFGQLIEIDFGFCFGHATGGIFSLEKAPFKLTKDMVQLMGPAGFRQFQAAFADGLSAARTILDECATLIEIMQYKSNFPCFKKQSSSTKAVSNSFRRRHFPHLSDADLRLKAKQLCMKSLNSTGTYLYDVFQYRTNKIAY